ncbi:MAG: hypothetical protein ABI724_17995 [Betaproteobacteria bacterium]
MSAIVFVSNTEFWGGKAMTTLPLAMDSSPGRSRRSDMRPSAKARSRLSVRRLAALLVAITFALLACAPASAQGSSRVRFVGNAAYSFDRKIAVLTANKVSNFESSGVSGPLTLELWAFASPYAGTGTKTDKNGLKLAEFALGQLNAGSNFLYVDSGPIAFASPMKGIWFFTLFVTESVAGVTARDDWKNFSQPVVIGPVSTIVPVAGIWWNPEESGTGYAIDYQNGVLLVQSYSYQFVGTPQWYLAAGEVDSNTFGATLDRYVDGQCISCAYTPAALVGNDGAMSIVFTSPTTATAYLPGGRQIQIERYFGAAPSVPVSASAIAPVAGVWWNPNESGTGYGLDYQSGTLLVQIYSFQPGGQSQWYLAAGQVNANVFTATLDKYAGGQCISCSYTPATHVGNDGNISMTFTSPTTANVVLPGGRQIQIQRYFGP